MEGKEVDRYEIAQYEIERSFIMKCCNTCTNNTHCWYRGIIDPCDEYEPKASASTLRCKARTIVDKKMSFEEHRFVTSCTTLISFTPKQHLWLLSIFNRF